MRTKNLTKQVRAAVYKPRLSYLGKKRVKFSLERWVYSPTIWNFLYIGVTNLQANIT